jgi:Ca2+/Na+ antiporter
MLLRPSGFYWKEDQVSQVHWAMIRRTFFVLTLAWLFGAVSWAMLPVPTAVSTMVLFSLVAAYVYALTKWKLPKSNFSDIIAHESHISNVALREAFVSAIFALPVLLVLAWLSQ